MIFEIKAFEELTTKELYEIMKARADVFVDEQRILYPDADGIDYKAIHVFTKSEGGRVEAYLRMFEKEDSPGTVTFGRVLSRSRGEGMGTALVRTALEAAQLKFGAKSICLDSQKHAEGFYHKLGFTTVSKDFIEAGILHVAMRIDLKNND